MVQTDICVENSCLIKSFFTDHNRLPKLIEIKKCVLLILVNIYLSWKVSFASFTLKVLLRSKKEKVLHIKLRICITETL